MERATPLLHHDTALAGTLTGVEAAADSTRDNTAWWTDAVVYQVYIRSFADGSGDGIGDIAGLRARIPYLAALGVNALWINPWYPSPQADAGYDVADFRDIEPDYGTLEEADLLLAEAHAAGLKVILDIVPNHTSSAYRWFVDALAGDEAARARYIFRPGKGENGELPPNDWQSIFGGPAWTRTTGPDGSPGDWYLHLFAPAQPDLEWNNPEVRAEFGEILRFWFDRGVDGFRIDVAHGLAKADGLPDGGANDAAAPHNEPHPAWDNDAVHDIYRDWRRVADAYDPPRVFVAEAWVRDNERLALYLRPDELHTAFQFDFLRAPFDAAYMKEVVDDARAAAAATGGTSTWVLSNHDVVRHVTRYARSQPDHMVESTWDRLRWTKEEPDLALGTERARAAAQFILALPGTVYLYQGEELGLPEVEDVPDDARQDPVWFQGTNGDPGRDGCRIPLPWDAEGTNAGFSPGGTSAAPWLPQPAGWSRYAMSLQDSDPDSVLNHYRAVLATRREVFGRNDDFAWVDSPDTVAAFRRGPVEVWLNTGSAPVDLPVGEVLLSSSPAAAARASGTPAVLAPNSTVWLHRS